MNPLRHSARSAAQLQNLMSIVGWISEAHPPLKTTTIILHRAKNDPPVRFADTPLVKQGGKEMNPLRHSARSETELKNPLNKKKVAGCRYFSSSNICADSLCNTSYIFSLYFLLKPSNTVLKSFINDSSIM